MKLEGPVEVVFDTSVIIGAILESWGEEKGSSRIALNSLIKRCNHTLRISEDIRKGCRISKFLCRNTIDMSQKRP